MSLSQKIKIGLFSILFILPMTADGAELKFEDKLWEVAPTISTTHGYNVRNDFNLAEFLKLSYTNKQYALVSPKLDQATLDVLAEAAEEINQPTKNAKMQIVGDWAKDFEPGQNGQGLDSYKALKMLAQGNPTIELPVLVSKPAVSLEQLNNLGINELLATGESDFAGSPRNRRVNINVGTSKYTGYILKPGEEFSFNKLLGEVDAANGFLPELVIKRTGVVPEFGGGLCQVSSTVFRAAMKAGLPIVERRNHSFAVKYYAPQGTDATIYPGITDFRFKNDLASHILINTRIEGDKLYFDFYGTKDDRKVSFDGPYQYDKKANGALKATWTRNVEQDGETKTQTFNSTYQPPALFQQTTQASTPNPQATENTNVTPTPTEETPTPTPSPAPTT